jgi:pilin isopeptide linkage protein
MKRIITFSIMLILLLTPAFPAIAAYYEPVMAEVPLEITNGGTAEIISNVNCPIPQESKIELDDGEIGKFEIYFTDVGVYTYTVKSLPDDRDMVFDDKEYTVEVHVTDEGGKLAATVIAYTGENKYSSRSDVMGIADFGPERLLFEPYYEESPAPPMEPDSEPATEPTDETPPTEKKTDGDSAHGKNRNPKTGDDTRMEVYFTVAMLASAGLFVLSLVYRADTRKMLKNKDE